jgi:hypothetical protein
MGKASSSKKVARAARAGGSRRPGQRRNLGFPTLITVIVVLGVALVLFARGEREANAEPRRGADHWHAAYGLYVCDAFQPPLNDVGQDTLGIHTHGDGVIHIHPFLDSAAGTNAQLGIWFDQVQLSVTDDSIVLPDGTAYEEGDDDCDGDDAIVQVWRWAKASDAAEGKEPAEVITEDFDDIRFRSDREAYTIAFAPEDADIPAPESIPTLDNLSDVLEAPTSSTEPDDSTSTTSGGSSTTTGDTTSTTAADPAATSTTASP